MSPAAAARSHPAVARLGRGRVLLAGFAVQLVGTVMLLAVAAGARAGVATVAVAVLGLARGALNTVIFTVFTDFCRPATAGTDFTFLPAWGCAWALHGREASGSPSGSAEHAVQDAG